MHICFQLIEQHFQRYVFPKVGKIKPRADLVLLLKISACQISALNELSSDSSVAAQSYALPDYSSTLESSCFCFHPFLFPNSFSINSETDCQNLKKLIVVNCDVKTLHQILCTDSTQHKLLFKLRIKG